MATMRTQRSLDRVIPVSVSVPHVEQFDSDSDEEAIVVDERFGAAIPPTTTHAATNSSQNASNNVSVGHGPDVRSIIVGILHASKPVSAAPAVHATAKPPLARPTSASSVSRRQVAASLDPPFLKERGAPPLHSSQPAVFRKQKPSPAPFGVSGPRMLIDWEGGRDFGPAPGDYCPLPVPVEQERDAASLRHRRSAAGVLRPVNKQPATFKTKTTHVPTTFGTSSRFPLREPDSTPAPCDYSPVVVPVVRTGETISREQLGQLYEDAAATAGKPDRPSSAGFRPRSASRPASASSVRDGTPSRSRTISVSSITALHAGCSVTVKLPSSARQHEHPLASARSPRAVLPPVTTSHDNAPASQFTAPPTPSIQSSAVSSSASTYAAPVDIARGTVDLVANRLEGVHRLNGEPVLDPFIQFRAVFKCADEDSVPSPIQQRGQTCKTYPVSGGGGDAVFLEAHGKRRQLLVEHPDGKHGRWTTGELILRVDVCDFGHEDSEARVGFGSVDLMHTICKHGIVPCLACAAPLLDYIVTLRDAQRHMCGRAHFSARVLLTERLPSEAVVVDDASVDPTTGSLSCESLPVQGLTVVTSNTMLPASPSLSTAVTVTERTDKQNTAAASQAVGNQDAPVDTVSAPMPMSARTVVWAKRGDVWCSGTALLHDNANESGPTTVTSSFTDVHFDDGLVESVDVAVLRRAGSLFRVHDAVEIRLRDTGCMVPAVVQAVRTLGSSIVYDVVGRATGLVSRDVPEHRLEFGREPKPPRTLPSSTAPSPPRPAQGLPRSAGIANLHSPQQPGMRTPERSVNASSLLFSVSPITSKSTLDLSSHQKPRLEVHTESVSIAPSSVPFALPPNRRVSSNSSMYSAVFDVDDDTASRPAPLQAALSTQGSNTQRAVPPNRRTDSNSSVYSAVFDTDDDCGSRPVPLHLATLHEHQHAQPRVNTAASARISPRAELLAVADTLCTPVAAHSDGSASVAASVSPHEISDDDDA